MIIALTSCWTNKAMAYVSLRLERLSAFQWSSSKTSWICIFPQQSLTPLVGRSSILGHSQKRWVCKWGLEGDERRLKEWERRQATSPLPCPASQPTLPPRQHSFRKKQERGLQISWSPWTEGASQVQVGEDSQRVKGVRTTRPRVGGEFMWGRRWLGMGSLQWGKRIGFPVWNVTSKCLFSLSFGWSQSK